MKSTNVRTYFDISFKRGPGYSVFQQDQTNCIDLKRRLNKGVRAAEEVR